MDDQETVFCTYCGKRAELYPVKVWNKDEYRHYCADHYHDIVKYEQENAARFIEFYSAPERRKWLDSNSLELWEKLQKGNNRKC